MPSTAKQRPGVFFFDSAERVRVILGVEGQVATTANRSDQWDCISDAPAAKYGPFQSVAANTAIALLVP
jgi:hypothetical protein